ncbi:MAG: hypothetical protein SFX73_25830 [Kofleriaceae bacterium]|nr:hypothetical protein [Kofleriaceae bacterium]
MRRLRSFALAAAASASLLACGDDGGGNTTPDAPGGSDASVDSGPSCTTVTLDPAFLFNTDSDDSFINWSQDVTSSLGSGAAFLNWEFYAGGSALSGAINLASGDQANYKTCSACVRLIVINEAGDAIEKQFFQSGGTLNLTEDPFTNQVLAGSTTDLTLTEVTIADDYTSTPVSGGTCISLGSLTLAADAVPAEWTCQKAQYNDGATCNCACGAHDPDCDIDNAPVAGCTGNQVCGSEDTCIDVCSVNNPATGCPANSFCGYETADRDVCYTDNMLKDAAALGGTCASATPLFCAVNGSNIATGLCDKFEKDDLKCNTACDTAADCGGGGAICAPVIGTKGICVTPPTNDTCETATALTIGGAAITGNTGGATGNYNAGLETATCTGFSQAGGDVAYSVALTANQAITVTVSAVSARFDPSVAIVGPGAASVCNANPIACLKGADAGVGGAGETFTYTAATAGTYYIIVDAFDTTQGGGFSIAVTSP